MAIALIQCVGVFFAALSGVSILGKLWRGTEDIQVFILITFALGMAMALCGLFF